MARHADTPAAWHSRKRRRDEVTTATDARCRWMRAGMGQQSGEAITSPVGLKH